MAVMWEKKNRWAIKAALVRLQPPNPAHMIPALLGSIARCCNQTRYALTTGDGAIFISCSERNATFIWVLKQRFKLCKTFFFTSTSLRMYVRLTHLDPFLSLLKRWFWGSVSRFSLIQTGIWSRIVSRTGHFQNKGLAKQPRWDIQRSANRQTCVFASDHSPW